MKQCKKCNQTLALENFHFSSTEQRYSYQCKQCYSKYYQEYISNKETKAKKSKYRREHYLKNRVLKPKKPLEERLAEKREKARLRWHKDLNYKLYSNVGHYIRQCLFAPKTERYKDILEFTTEELKKHLESLFDSDMNWGNYGRGQNKWSIDHRVPRKYIKENGEPYWNQNALADANSEEFKQFWSLKNLQPKWNRLQTSKLNRYID